MEAHVVASRVPAALKDKVFHADIRIESVEDAPRHDLDSHDGARQVDGSDTAFRIDVADERAAEMQMWWDDAIQRNMDLPDNYAHVAVLLVKWADELDELKTRKETEELETVFREHFHFQTEIVDLNVASKPQHQLNRHLSTFVEKHDGPKNLLIIYYTGHGSYLDNEQFLELTASQVPSDRGFSNVARCNWNKVEAILQSDDVEADVLTILDTCYASNLVKSGKEETRNFELLSASAIDRTTAGPGDNSFTRALIDALRRLLKQSGDKGFTTFHLNQGILLDKRRATAPSQLWFRLQQHHGRHIHLAPLKPEVLGEKKALRIAPRGYLTLRFALRDETLNREQIEFLTKQLSKAFSNKLLVGLSRIDWLGIKPAPATHFRRAALAMFAIAQWKKFLSKRRQEKESEKRVDEVQFPILTTADDPSESPTRKRAREGFSDPWEPEPKREYLAISEPPSPPMSHSSRT